jgi:hypothetical protein
MEHSPVLRSVPTIININNIPKNSLELYTRHLPSFNCYTPQTHTYNRKHELSSQRRQLDLEQDQGWCSLRQQGEQQAVCSSMALIILEENTGLTDIT